MMFVVVVVVGDVVFFKENISQISSPCPSTDTKKGEIEPEYHLYLHHIHFRAY